MFTNTSARCYVLTLYVAGETLYSKRAIKRLRRILDQRIRGVYSLKIIDVAENPEIAEADKISATPTLTKEIPFPAQQYVGDLSNPENMLLSLGIW